MFEQLDLSKKTDDDAYAQRIEPLHARIGVLQRELHDSGTPVIVVVEGWNASGITLVINELIQYLDPRGFSMHSIGSPDDEERSRHFLWRFWKRTPARGRMAIFARSWYSRSLAEHVSGIDWKEGIRHSIDSINVFERQLADDGVVILKFFLHISKEEQRRRLDEREKDALTSWMITRGDWDFHKHYDSYLPVIEQYIRKTDTRSAPWTVVEATDSNYTRLKVYSTVIRRLEKKLAKVKENRQNNGGKAAIAKPARREVTREAEPLVTYPREEYDRLLTDYQEQARDIQYLLYKRKVPLIIVYEGWDAAGKGGNIMRLVHRMNPRGYDVVPVARANQTELDHHFLWRFYLNFPRAGHITIFDRSWYGRVLVERVEGYCGANEWKRAFQEINETEELFVDNGGGLIKFWLEVSREEQYRRFMARQEDPLKQWKMTGEDWRNREKWDQYEDAIDEMLARTSTAPAPWTVVESDDKYFARIKALQTLIEYGERLFR
jgi:polyphosphate:AMP phosphotransferase